MMMIMKNMEKEKDKLNNKNTSEMNNTANNKIGIAN